MAFPGRRERFFIPGSSRCDIPQKAASWRVCEENSSLCPVFPSRSDAFRPGRCPCRDQFRAAQASELDEKVHEATEEGTKESAKIAKKSGEKLEEASSGRAVIVWLCKELRSPTFEPIIPVFPERAAARIEPGCFARPAICGHRAFPPP